MCYFIKLYIYNENNHINHQAYNNCKKTVLFSLSQVQGAASPRRTVQKHYDASCLTVALKKESSADNMQW